MTTFPPRQSDCGRHARKTANASMVQMHVTNCTTKLNDYVHEAWKIQCSKVQGGGQTHVMEWEFYTRQALPLVKTRFLQLAKISPMIERSPASWLRVGRATSGRMSKEISRVMSAQLFGSSRAVATAMPPTLHQDDPQDNLPWDAMSAPETARQLAAWSRTTAPQFAQRPHPAN